jgi:hypothetical protein
MKTEKKKCLMIFIEDTDTWKGERLYEVIIRVLHRHKLDGATAIGGITGFGASGRIHRTGIVSDEKPVVIVSIDSDAKIKEAIEAVGPLVTEGIICTYDTEVFTMQGVPGGK